MTRVILLGAGASFGSVDAIPHPPPLGDKLFAALEARGGQAATLPEALKVKFRERFELGMAAFEEHVNGNVMRFQRELAHYLAEFTPGPKSVYLRLIRAVGYQRVVFSSLNYDLLFELSAGALHLNTTYSSQNSAGSVRLLKIHGSSNFWPDMGSNQFQGCTFSGCGVDIEAPVLPLNQYDTIKKCLSEDSLAPAIAMYAEGKKKKVCPIYVDEQQRQWTAAVQGARKVGIVGTRIYSQDDHVWGTLADSRADIYYYGISESDRSEFDVWKANAGRRNIYFVKANFEEAVALVAKIMKT